MVQSEATYMKTLEQLIELDRVRIRKHYSLTRYQYRASDNIYTVALSKEEAIKRANEAIQLI